MPWPHRGPTDHRGSPRHSWAPSALRSHCTVTPRSAVSGLPSHHSVWAVAQGRAGLSGCPLPLGCWAQAPPSLLVASTEALSPPGLCSGPSAAPPTSPASTQLLNCPPISFHRLPQCPLPPLSLLPRGTEGLGHWALETSSRAQDRASEAWPWEGHRDS